MSSEDLLAEIDKNLVKARALIKGADAEVENDAGSFPAPAMIEEENDHELTARGRHQIKESNFAWPEERKYPIEDKEHRAAAKTYAKKELEDGNISKERYDSIMENIRKKEEGNDAMNDALAETLETFFKREKENGSSRQEALRAAGALLKDKNNKGDYRSDNHSRDIQWALNRVYGMKFDSSEQEKKMEKEMHSFDDSEDDETSEVRVEPEASKAKATEEVNDEEVPDFKEKSKHDSFKEKSKHDSFKEKSKHDSSSEDKKDAEGESEEGVEADVKHVIPPEAMKTMVSNMRAGGASPEIVDQCIRDCGGNPEDYAATLSDEEVRSSLSKLEKAAADARRDSEAAKNEISRLAEGQRGLSDEEYNELADTQSQADAVLEPLGLSTPRYIPGQSLNAYKRGIAKKIQSFSSRWKEIDLRKLDPAVSKIAMDEIFNDAREAARKPRNYARTEQARQIKRRLPTGQVQIDHKGAWSAGMGPWIA